MIDEETRQKFIDSLTDEELAKYAFAVPWASSQSTIRPKVDEDGFPTFVNMTDFTGFDKLQTECWNQFIKNPQINSYIRDYMGRLTGYGFEINSDISEINDYIDDICEDPRNDLYCTLPKYAARSEIEGELFLALTLHKDGFVEVDFMEPSALKGGGDNNSGIIYHPNKPTMPLMYLFNVNSENGTKTIPIPSINIAYYPELKSFCTKHKDYVANSKNAIKKRGNLYRKIGGFNTFIVAWDRGYLTKRNVSHIRTVIEWINHYESLKKYEIDHKRSSGAYLWVAKIADPKAYRTWLAMSDDQKKKTGLLQKKTPGGTIVLPPGMDLTCVNPDLPKISDQDTDILRMVISGLNRPEDMVTGQSSGSTFAGIKSSRGPQSDRTSDDIAYFERFLRFHLWRGILFLGTVAGVVKKEYLVDEAVGFEKINKVIPATEAIKDNSGKVVTPATEEKVETYIKPIMNKVRKKIHKLVHFSFPVSELSDIEGVAKAYLGVKHGSVVDTLGIPPSEVAKKLGFTGYPKLRLRTATEGEKFPKLISTLDAESVQEKTESEVSSKNNGSANKKSTTNKSDTKKETK